MIKILPNLDLHDVNDAALDEYTADKVKKINQVPAFASVLPSTADVDAKRTEYVHALTAADNGRRADTRFKKDKRMELERMLTRQAQNCATIAGGDLALYLSSGYAAKNVKGTPGGSLPAVTGLFLDYGESDGELKAGWKAMARAQNFTVQVYSNPDDPDGSLIKQFLKPKLGKKMTVLDGLPSGEKVFARVRANGGSEELNPWSATVTKRVP